MYVNFTDEKSLALIRIKNLKNMKLFIFIIPQIGGKGKQMFRL